MNMEALKHYERQFYLRFPGGWDNPELVERLKKHKVKNVHEFALKVLQEDALRHPNQAIQDITKLLSKASMVSVFEKVRFRNLIKESDQLFIQDLVDAIDEMVNHDQERGFERLVGLLSPYKLAKWPIITALLFYGNPTVEVLVKPTTVKAIIKQLDLEGLQYSPKVNYPFYRAYRDTIHALSQHVKKELSITTAHFSGFLMSQTQ